MFASITRRPSPKELQCCMVITCIQTFPFNLELHSDTRDKTKKPSAQQHLPDKRCGGAIQATTKEDNTNKRLKSFRTLMWHASPFLKKTTRRSRLEHYLDPADLHSRGKKNKTQSDETKKTKCITSYVCSKKKGGSIRHHRNRFQTLDDLNFVRDLNFVTAKLL
jgi:hypothetical protein